jgi:hypothetical protein
VTGNETQLAFIHDVLPDARSAATHLGIPTSVVLAQWINETGAGTSQAWRECHNYAGVSGMEGFQESLGAHLMPGGAILCYPSREAGLAGYIGRWADGVYDATREQWREHPDAHAVAAAIEASPWAAGHYGGNGLRALLDELNLTQYDGGVLPDEGPPQTEQPPCGALRPGPAPQGHSTLKVGARGPEVVELQLRLEAEGFAPGMSRRHDGTYDGVFGSSTANAVAELQSARGLHRDGIVGRQTWCALGVR